MKKTMKLHSKRVLAMLIALVMCLGMLNLTVFAAEEETQEDQVVAESVTNEETPDANETTDPEDTNVVDDAEESAEVEEAQVEEPQTEEPADAEEPAEVKETQVLEIPEIEEALNTGLNEGIMLLSFDVETTEPTRVYVYVKFENPAGGDGFNKNDSGWYTIGYVDVDANVLKAASTYTGVTSSDPDNNPHGNPTQLDAVKVLVQENMTRYLSNADMKIDFTSDDVVWTEFNSLFVTTGANVETEDGTADKISGNQWHMNIWVKNPEVVFMEYTVKHLDKDTGTQVASPETYEDTLGCEIKAEGYVRNDIKGYKYDGAKEDSIILTASGENVLTLYYVANSYSYTVNYLEQGTNDVLDTVTGNAKFGSVIPADVKTFDGYKYVSGDQSITIGTEEDANVLNLYYVKETKDITLSYDANGGVNAPDPQTQSVTEDSATFTVGDAPSRDGYEFVKWYKGTKDYQPGDKITITADTMLTALWKEVPKETKPEEPTQYTLTVIYEYYDVDGTMVKSSSETETVNAGETKVVGVFEIPGYTTNDKTQTIVMDQDRTITVRYDKTPAPKPETMIVQWLDGYSSTATGSRIAFITINAGDNYDDRYPNAPKREGYTFTSWSDPEEGVAADGQKVITITAEWAPTVPDTGDGNTPTVPDTDDDYTPPSDDDDDDYTPPVVDIEDETPPLSDLPMEEEVLDDEDVPLADLPEELTEDVIDLEDEDVPLADLPEELTDLEDEDVPMAGLPEGLTDLEDSDVPLDAVPQTGDESHTALWAVLSLLSLGGMVALFPRKKSEDEV